MRNVTVFALTLLCLDDRYSYLNTVITIVFEGEAGHFGGKASTSQIPSIEPCQKSRGQRLVFLWLIEPKHQPVTKSIET